MASFCFECVGSDCHRACQFLRLDKLNCLIRLEQFKEQLDQVIIIPESCTDIIIQALSQFLLTELHIGQ
jgi:hypothetical protein